MSTRRNLRGVVTGALVLLMTAIAVPALAQGIKGRVFNQQHRVVSGADVVATCVSNPKLEPKGTTTDGDGRFGIGGLQFGKWNVVVTKGNLVFQVKEPLNLLPGVINDIGDVTVEPIAAGAAAPVANSKADADARNKKAAELQTKFKAANDDVAAGRYDDAIVKLTAVAAEIPKCAACSARLGEVYIKKEDLATAEKSFLQAIEYDEKMVDAYNALATIYNTQQKFDEALKMSAKARELTAATGASQDPSALFNEAVVMWNAGKISEAEPLFKKVTELDPQKSQAFFQLGMAEVNLGKLPEAIAAFEAYLKLDPKGKDADQAKTMLAAIKK